MNKKLVREQFGASAESYVTSKPHAKGKSLQRLVELVQPQASWRVLDVATGAGHTALAVAPYVREVIASDITPEMLAKTAELAAERGVINLRTETVDAEQMPFEDNTFELVTCRIAAHHFPQIPLFVAEAKRVLRPGGILAVVDNVVPAGEVGDYVNSFEKLRDPSHGRCLTLAAWVSLYEGAGLSVTHTETLEKAIAFDSWAGRMVGDEETIEQLQALLSTGPAGAQSFFHPETIAGALHFHLQEGLLLGQKVQAKGSLA